MGTPQQDVSRILQGHQRIIIFAGAGISTSAGVPDTKSNRGPTFDETVYRSAESLRDWHRYIQTMQPRMREAEPTAFHHLADLFAYQERLCRLYTQNVDGIELKLPHLHTTVPLRVGRYAPNTVQLHGSIHHMACNKCNWTSPIEVSLFQGSRPPACPRCTRLSEERVSRGRRSLNPGALRPRILLQYHEAGALDTRAIGRLLRDDLGSEPDALVVAGASLRNVETRRVVRRMCQAVHKDPNGVTIWLNKELPPASIMSEFDIVVLASCDWLARNVADGKGAGQTA